MQNAEAPHKRNSQLFRKAIRQLVPCRHLGQALASPAAKRAHKAPPTLPARAQETQSASHLGQRPPKKSFSTTLNTGVPINVTLHPKIHQTSSFNKSLSPAQIIITQFIETLIQGQ
jgi:hypothetical protein